MGAWEGYWYLSEKSIQTLLGDRLPLILEAFRQVKTQLAIYLRNPSKIDVEAFINEHKASMSVALQVDGLAQTSLQIVGNTFTLFTVVEGEAVTKETKIIDLSNSDPLTFTTVKLFNSPVVVATAEEARVAACGR